MLKKVLTMFMLLTLAVSFVPQESYCDDHIDSVPAHHHCSFTCHACFHVIAPASDMGQPVFYVSDFKILDVFSYQNPIITRLKRPPIQRS